MEEELHSREHIDAKRRQTDAPQTIADARLEIAETRTRMSGTIAELEQRVSGRIDRVKQKVDAAALVRQHPWPALAAAFVAGVALSATGADRRAARAAKRAAKRAPETAKRGASSAAHATAAGVSQLAGAVVERIKGSPDDRADRGDAEDSGGLTSKATGGLGAQVRELGAEIRRGADELAGSVPPPRTAGT
ncbi:MAG: hypothetical protein DMD35_16955 [Gemmatimonadetes bacterium]|nr:MAG: hypothetical protein DMD35_16955 [Gemmatimonadota bacterium]